MDLKAWAKKMSKGEKPKRRANPPNRNARMSNMVPPRDDKDDKSDTNDGKLAGPVGGTPLQRSPHA